MEKDQPTLSYRISDMAQDDKPRERLAAQGPAVLTNGELIAILIRTGTKGHNAIQIANDLLTKYEGLRGIYRAPFSELQREFGLGLAKAATIKAAIELGNRLSLETPEDKRAISSPKDAADLLLHPMGSLEQEEFRVMLLDRRNKVISIELLYRGSVSSSQIRIAEVFKEAVRKNCSSVILFHNHPSGDPDPSNDDIAVTRGIVQAGKILEVEVLDHIIIGNNRWYSMKEKGQVFSP